MNIKSLAVLVLLFSLFCRSLPAAEAVVEGQPLSVRQCIDIALDHHPSIRAAGSNIEQAESRICQARAGYLPQIGFQSAYSRIGPPATALRTDPYNAYSHTLSLNQTLFDFGKTWTQMDISGLQTDAARNDFEDVRASVIFDVKQAFYDVVKTSMSEKVAQETLKQFEEHYQIAKTFFETGKSSKIDVTSAEVNLTNARIQLLSAQNASRLAHASLSKAMGVTSMPSCKVIEEFQTEMDDLSFDEALSYAMDRRPDLQSIAKKTLALEKNVRLTRKNYLPVLSGGASYGYSGDDTSMDDSWTVGVSLSVPIFSGLSTKYAVDEAVAGAKVAQANMETLRQRIQLEVQTAWLGRAEAFQRIDAGRTIVRQAEETLELARGRYTTGVGSSIEITDAMTQLNNAKMIHITALADFAVAQAALEKAMGAFQ